MEQTDDSNYDRFEPDCKWEVVLPARPTRVVRYIPNLLIGLLLATVCAGYGLSGVASGQGVADKNRREIAPGSTEAMITAWAFCFCGVTGLLIATCWFCWNAYVVETVQIRMGTLVIRRSVLFASVERAFFLSDLSDVSCQTYENKDSPAHTLGFLDFSVVQEGVPVVVFKSLNEQYCFGLNLTDTQATEIATIIQQTIENLMPR